MEATFRDKLAEIDKEQKDLQARMKKMSSAVPKEEISEAMVRKYLSSFAVYPLAPQVRFFWELSPFDAEMYLGYQ